METCNLDGFVFCYNYDYSLIDLRQTRKHFQTLSGVFGEFKPTKAWRRRVWTAISQTNRLEVDAKALLETPLWLCSVL